MTELPKVDTRTAADVSRQVLTALQLDGLREEQLKGRLDVALVGIFARFSEIVIERLNRAPEKKFLAFLDLLGFSPLPMESATVPVTFYPVANLDGSAVIPVGTQVAAAPAMRTDGNQRPVIFETMSELAATTTQLDSLFATFGRDEYADLGASLPSTPLSQQDTVLLPDFAAARTAVAIPHLFYVAIPSNPSWISIEHVTLDFQVEASPVSDGAPCTVQWEATCNPTTPGAGAVQQILSPSSDTSASLSTSGRVEFRSVPAVAPTVIDGQTACWISCRLLTPGEDQRKSADESEDPQRTPVIKSVTAECEHGGTDLPVENAFYEKQALDVSKILLPFGPRPSLGDAFYLGSHQAFSEMGAVVDLKIEVASTGADDATTPLVKSSTSQLSWEYWDGQAWCVLNPTAQGAKPKFAGAVSAVEWDSFADGTNALLKSGVVHFQFPTQPVERVVNGVKGYWVRAHISAGDYGRETHVERDPSTGVWSTVPSTLAPPCLQSVTVSYSLGKSVTPEVVLMNAWRPSRITPGSSSQAFLVTPQNAAVPALYVGFTTKVGPLSTLGGGTESFPRLPVSAYFLIDECSPRAGAIDSAQMRSTWEYWDGSTWKGFTVADRTDNLRRSGLIEFLVPQDFVQSSEFARRRFWLRMRLAGGKPPRLRSILLNTTMATQGVTIRNEILGGSSGEACQRFRTSSAGVLPGQKLEVCEPTMPTADELKTLRKQLDGEACVQPAGQSDQAKGYWVQWREVTTLNASAARDRHYVLDHITGEVLFGDGVCGLIPPPLAGNIRICKYRSGGGAMGNVAAFSIKQLVSAVPYIQKVVNWIPATGGGDPEPESAVMDRGPRELRHGGRAVTLEDYEDLALRSSRQVAKVLCLPHGNLAQESMGRTGRLGVVRVLVVPRSLAAKPVPTVELLEHVRSFLDARRVATAELAVIGPEYVRVDISAEIVLEQTQRAYEVERRVDAAISNFLHPVCGGPLSAGWEFGRLPQRSNLYVMIEHIPGVNHVRDLSVTLAPDRAGVEKTKHFLVYSGCHSLSFTF